MLECDVTIDRTPSCRVKVERGPGLAHDPVAARGSWSPQPHRPFPPPAHRTLQAVFPHTALGRVSHPGMSRRRQADTAQREHPPRAEHPSQREAPRPSSRG